MKKQTALLLMTIAALLVMAGLATRGDGGGLLGRWLAALHSNAGR